MKTNSLLQNGILNAIGNTPLVQLKKIVPENCAAIYLKLEYFNPTGSYKDRMALSIISEAERKGILKPGMTVVEFTGGSTGTSLALVCSAKGYSFKAVSSDAFAKEKLKSMEMFGAELVVIPSVDGKITPELFADMTRMVEQLTTSGNAFRPDQFYNTDALKGYQEMGKEILDHIGRPVDVFCAGVGTAGMLTGVATELKKKNPATRVVALEPASAPLISTGVKGSHKIEGIGVGIIPPLLHKDQYDEILEIDETDARMMAKLLVTQEGILAGTSSGLNVVAAIALGKKLGPDYAVVTVACDSGMKYFAGGLFD
ncbi:MAG: cysteine synthase family protein [Cyclobacteriaceae bacterium]